MKDLTKFLKESAWTRWFPIFLISTLMFSNYYFYDIFSSIKDTLQTQTDMSNADYGKMYGLYSFTNTFLLMVLFGGITLDKWGIRKVGTIFIPFIFIGALLTAYGATYDYKWAILMLAELGVLGVIFTILIKKRRQNLRLRFGTSIIIK